MHYKQYLLYTKGTLKSLSESEAHALRESSISRINQRYSSFTFPLRETMTISGFHLFTGIPVRFLTRQTIYPLYGGLWLIEHTLVTDDDPGTPSA